MITAILNSYKRSNILPEQIQELFGNLIENCYIDVECPYEDGFTREKVNKIS